MIKTTTREVEPLSKDVTIGKMICFMADNKEILVAETTRLLKEKEVDIDSPDVFLACVSPCGITRAYETADDIPETDDKCDCDYHPNHWFIKYTQ